MITIDRDRKKVIQESADFFGALCTKDQLVPPSVNPFIREIA
ncbi:hypothetical protein RAM19_01090 [Bartonella apihabitans]|nr:hypothetical protein [Bartonella apihabitans]WLT08886.1 hypothetical protein RAM19_01090 [Bartonella apihabitans]